MTHVISDMKGFLGELFDPAMTIVRIVGIIILAILCVKIGSYLIKKILEKQKAFKYHFDDKKVATMSSLLVSIYRYAIYIIAAVTILANEFKLNSVLAAAGIGGVAIGLGAQGLIKDVISGFFIIMEDQFIVGDLITVDTMTGTVEQMELRVTKLRHFNGDLFIIPNGEIKKVTNHTRGNKAAIVDIPLLYDADIDKAVEVAAGVCKSVMDDSDKIVEEPSVQGITEFGKEYLTLRIIAKTLPNEQWEVERRIRRLVKEEFAKSDIPFPPKAR